VEALVTAVRIVACAVAAVLGVGALMLAHDIHSWQAAVDRGDVRYTTQPATARWETGTWLPQGVTLRTLGLDDDLRLRRAEQRFARLASRGPGLDGGRRWAEQLAGVQVALSDIVLAGSPAQASRAGNLLGIISAGRQGGADPTVEIRAANATFDAAVRADPGNVYPKHNLELLLRRLKTVGTREGVGGSIAGDYGQALPGAGAGLPGSGY
jgi:hypothetical protein